MFEEIGEEEGITWSAFETRMLDNAETVRRERKARMSDGLPADIDDFIYRGQSNYQWELETSYERFLKNEFELAIEKPKLRNYYYGLSSIIPAINSLTDHKFERFNAGEIKFDIIGQLPQYNLLCFSRHLGFPSPLLDWTSSPYVAAFFAFRDARPDQNVAIFACQIWQGEGRSWTGGDPMINDHGSYVQTHHRHFRQQSLYTSCTSEKGDEYYICRHEDAVKANPSNQKIFKYTLKSSERKRVLEHLYSMNINDFTLFGDEESLMRMLAFKERNRFDRLED